MIENHKPLHRNLSFDIRQRSFDGKFAVWQELWQEPFVSPLWVQTNVCDSLEEAQKVRRVWRSEGIQR